MGNWKGLSRRIYRRLRGLYLYGSARHCPLCDGSFRRFLPKGIPVRLEAMCPRCLSLERHRLLWLFLKRELRIGEKPLTVLHFAPEPGVREKLQTSPALRYTTCDIAFGRGDIAMDITRLGFQSESFDLILCCHVLEHIPEDRTALNELCRVLKPGGRMVLQVPLQEGITDEDSSITDPAERHRRFGQYDHVRLYGEDFEQRVREAGFRVDVIEYSKQLSPGEIDRCRLMAEGEYEDRIFVARRDGD